MAHSSYQVERLLERLRRFGRWLSGPAHRRWRGADPVRFSAQTRRARAEEPPLAPPAPAAASVADVREQEPRAPEVEQERERRAGLFMEPPYPDELPPSRIPKRGPPPTRRRMPRHVAEGD